MIWPVSAAWPLISMPSSSVRGWKTPAVALAKKYIDEGRIGRILNFRGTYLQDWSADENGPLSWRFQKKIAGSGTVGDIATHVVDLAHYLVGPIAEVIAMTKTYVTTRPIQQGGVDKLGASEKSADAERAPVDVDDEVVSMLRFGNGAIGSLEATRNAWGRNNFITLEIHGTKGSIAFNYERRDELQVMFADDPADARGAPVQVEGAYPQVRAAAGGAGRSSYRKGPDRHPGTRTARRKGHRG